jgi:polysaccharide pyruvyl transferase WcaK-like protein
VAVVAMDPSDLRICRRVWRAIGQPERTRLVNCRQLDTVTMSAALSGFASMLTSRYHALVLPLAYAVPFVALGHDNRLRYITAEMGLEKFFVQYDEPDLVEVMADRHASLRTDAEALRSRLADAFADFRRRDQENYRLLTAVVRAAALSRGGSR